MPSSPAGRQAGVNKSRCCSFTTVSTIKVLISLALSSFCEDKGGFLILLCVCLPSSGPKLIFIYPTNICTPTMCHAVS